MDSGLELGRRPDFGAVRRFSHEAMATVFEVHAVHPPLYDEATMTVASASGRAPA